MQAFNEGDAETVTAVQHCKLSSEWKSAVTSFVQTELCEVFTNSEIALWSRFLSYLMVRRWLLCWVLNYGRAACIGVFAPYVIVRSYRINKRRLLYCFG
jgi:hypothetical protein